MQVETKKWLKVRIVSVLLIFLVLFIALLNTVPFSCRNYPARNSKIWPRGSIRLYYSCSRREA